MRPKDAVTSTWFEGGGVSRARVKGEGNYTLWSAAAERSFSRSPTLQYLKSFFSEGIVCTGMPREEPNIFRGATALS